MEAETTQPTQQPAQTFDIYKWMAWFHAHLKQVIACAAALAIIGSGLGIYFWKQGQNELEANTRLFSLPPAFGGGEKILGQPSAADLQSIANDYPSTSAGQQAELLAAQTFFVTGDYKKAQGAFEKFLADHESSPLAAQAAVGVAASLEAQKDIDGAIKKYQDIVSRYATAGVADPVKLTLARLYEKKDQPAQALKYYEELTRVPSRYDPWATEAQEREQLLLAKHPELKKPVAPPSAMPMLSPAKSLPGQVKTPSAAPAPAPAPAKAPAAAAKPAK